MATKDLSWTLNGPGIYQSIVSEGCWYEIHVLNFPSGSSLALAKASLYLVNFDDAGFNRELVCANESFGKLQEAATGHDKSKEK